jgi:hypothetical protein
MTYVYDYVQSFLEYDSPIYDVLAKGHAEYAWTCVRGAMLFNKLFHAYTIKL